MNEKALITAFSAWLAGAHAATAAQRQAVQEPKGRVTESIWNGEHHIIPLADVQHLEPKLGKYLTVVMKSSVFDNALGDYNNAPCLSLVEGEAFKAAWCRYRSELEAATLADLTPQPAQAPLTERQVRTLIESTHFRQGYLLHESDKVVLDWYRLGLRDGEKAHGIK